jgi:protease II
LVVGAFSKRLHFQCLPISPDFATSRSYSYGKQNLALRWLSSFHQKIQSNESDPYDRYRTTNITEDIWREIETENEQTRQSIDQDLYEQVLQEILQSMELLQKASYSEEPGPTGKFLYSFLNEPQRGRRQYRRRAADATSHTTFQTVAEYDASRSLVAMSLAVDESLVACLVEDETLQNPLRRVILRHVGLGVETELELVLPEDDCIVSSIELGPMQSPQGTHSLFLVTNDPLGRPHAVWACSVSMDEALGLIQRHSPPVLLYRSTDAASIVSVQRTKGCHYVAIQSSTKSENEVYLCRDIKNPPVLVLEKTSGIMYHLDVGVDDDVFLLISSYQETTNNADTGSLGIELSLWGTTVQELPLQVGSDTPCTLISPARGSEFVIADMDIFKTFIALYEKSSVNGTQRLRILPKPGATSPVGDCESITVPLLVPDIGGDCAQLSPGGNMHYAASHIRFAIGSPASPPCIYEYDALSGKIRFVSGNTTTPTNIQQRRLMVSSYDGSKVPLSLIYTEKPNLKENSTRPVVLIGYGSYGESLDLSFNPALTPLLERGFVLAFAHVRGGGDLCRNWYHRGRLYEKQNAIKDYVACASALCGEPVAITEPRKLTALGFSAAGVVIGAAVNENPGAFGTVVLANCFLDVKKTMENDALFLTEHEYEEFGNPKADLKAADAISSYCPVSNAHRPEEHSARFLLTGALDDHNVPFYNSLIYGKKVRENSRLKNRVNIHIESHGGHSLHPHIAALQATFIIANQAAYDTWRGT